MDGDCFEAAFRRGGLPMVRWLLQAGCPRWELGFVRVADTWPCDTMADSRQLLEAVQLLADAGWDAGYWTQHVRHPWVVFRTLCCMLDVPVREEMAYGAGAGGCTEMLEALAGMVLQTDEEQGLDTAWYNEAAMNGDRVTLARLRRLGVAMRPGLVRRALLCRAALPALDWLVVHGMCVLHARSVLGDMSWTASTGRAMSGCLSWTGWTG